MADPITLTIGAAGLFVAGVTAVANATSAYSQYRANHPRKKKTGRVENYTADHNGYSMTQQQQNGHAGQWFIDSYAYLVQQPQPSYQYFVPSPVTGYVDSPYPIHQQLPPLPRSTSYAQHQQHPPPQTSPSFAQQHFPLFSQAATYVMGRPGTAPQSPAQYQGPHQDQFHRSNSAPSIPNQHIPLPYQHQQVPHQRSNSAPHVPTQHIPYGVYRGPGPSRPPFPFGGTVRLEQQQQSRDTLKDTKIGMQTGRQPGYNQKMAEDHWALFYPGSLKVIGAIAVLNWSERVITMYAYSMHYNQYFRNYHVFNADLDAFGKSFPPNQVFTGVLKDSWLVGCNDELKLVEDDGQCKVKSSNCWSELGIQGHISGDLVFVEMRRAALFGLLQCRSKDPTLLNVDMVGGQRVQFVHVDSDFKNLETKNDCLFSVFSFETKGWAEDRVLVG